MKKTFGILTMLILLVVGTTMAQKGKKNKKNPELRKELRDHYRTNMYPVLQEKQAAIDAGLNGTDLASVNASRMEYSQLKAQARDAAKKRREMRKAGTDKEVIKEKRKTDKAEFKTAKKGIIESLLPLIDSNEELVKGVMLELRPLRKQWKTERKAIREKYAPADEEVAEKGKGKKKGKKGKDKAEFNKKRAAKFLMWDRNKAPKEPKAKGGKGDLEKTLDSEPTLFDDDAEDILGDD
ncbi:MAG: hypothetical protein GY810_15715 [Aureispira sp.]|nr:hypothetical protein [Aureispira sp.]